MANKNYRKAYIVQVNDSTDDFDPGEILRVFGTLKKADDYIKTNFKSNEQDNLEVVSYRIN